MRRFALLFVCLLFCFQCIAGIPIKSLFDSIKWTETESDFISNYHEQVTPIDHFHNEYGHWTCDYSMTDIMLGDLSLTFSINVDEKTKCIKFLSASVPFDSDPVAQLNSTESLLKELFGSPDIVEDELDSEFFRSKKILWFCTGYKIELNLMFLSSSTFLKMNVESIRKVRRIFG